MPEARHMTAEYPRNQGPRLLITRSSAGDIPPVALAVYVGSASAYVWLTPDEARTLAGHLTAVADEVDPPARPDPPSPEALAEAFGAEHVREDSRR